MRVGLVTTWDERCGVATYASNLVKYVKEIDFTIYGRDTWEWPSILTRFKDDKIDIVHISHEPGLFYWITPDMISSIKGNGIKTVLTHHTSNETSNRTPFTNVFDKVVIHEKTNDGFVYIPHGIPVVDDLATVHNSSLGTAGFPFPWKGFHAVAKASKLLNLGCTVIASESSHADTYVMRDYILRDQPATEYISEWMSEEKVIRNLSSCYVNIFAYSGTPSGISGAVRLGIAARRPLVLTRCRQFNDLYAYEDEIEFINNADENSIVNGVERVLISGKIPDRVIKDYNWKVIGEKYGDMYRTL